MEKILNPGGLLSAFPFIIIGINQLLKKVGLEEKWCPVVNIILGFMALPVFMDLGITWYYSAMGCLILGLSAGGFYDLGNKTILGK
jgi:hypothetical protein